ncbi:Reverse transcriptase (RNA-dependent DNA polymerase) [Rhizoctonia solani]|uniref:Reverse transcriptase (RNA-dependent DNA polymerase) n=1 Tax=Rhizoctonia solani TaxID=456999 RepID=A0A8H7IC75_9AGAM|nr:Reverse transcriptase (RNA-dependent DNA polymerase) [Rhizoctonia solani]
MVDYLGIFISPAGFSMDQKKVEAVASWPQPKTVKQVQAFLGFDNYLSWIPHGQWGNQEDQAFQELKSLVTKAPVLVYSNPELPYFLETDASGVAMGAVLSQRGPDNQLHPIAYMSKSFSGAKANYNTHDKELLALIKALEEWRIFLEAMDCPVQVFMDHRNLEYWMQAQTFNRRHAQWQIFLSDFNFDIHYCPGKQSGKLDTLSRRSDYIDATPELEVMLPSEVFANTSEEELEIVTEICSKLREDPSLDQIIQFLTEDVDNAPPSIQKAYREYNWEEDLLWYCRKLVVPDSEPLKERLLREFHDSPLAGHPGQQQTLELLSCNYWWPGMKSSAKEWVECCPTCQANQRPHAPVIALKPLEVPHSHFTPFHMTSSQDSFSKFGHFIPTSKKVSTKGLADLGTMFTGTFLRALYQQLGIKPLFSSAYHPKSDGQTERVNQFIEFYLHSHVAADHLDWAKWLLLAEYAYNDAKHAAMEEHLLNWYIDKTQ